MILVSVIGILLIGGVLAWLAGRWSERLARWISLVAIGIDLVLNYHLPSDQRGAAPDGAGREPISGR